ncbi:MAG: hypothetical protein ACLUAM_08680 [Bifidobacterium adolescentis]
MTRPGTKYLDEMTIDEMTTQLSDLFGTAEAASVNRPAYAVGDGTASVGGNTYAEEYGDARDVTLYPATMFSPAPGIMDACNVVANWSVRKP